jgi:hypothetical protein
MQPTHVVLRRVKDADGSRLLEASLTVEGNVLIEGWDLGDGVERVFGVREYEWTWTIPAASIPALLRALGVTDHVLAALQARFSGENAALLGPFLEENEIPTNRWSRLGD